MNRLQKIWIENLKNGRYSFYQNTPKNLKIETLDGTTYWSALGVLCDSAGYSLYNCKQVGSTIVYGWGDGPDFQSIVPPVEVWSAAKLFDPVGSFRNFSIADLNNILNAEQIRLLRSDSGSECIECILSLDETPEFNFKDIAYLLELYPQNFFISKSQGL